MDLALDTSLAFKTTATTSPMPGKTRRDQEKMWIESDHGFMLASRPNVRKPPSLIATDDAMIRIGSLVRGNDADDYSAVPSSTPTDAVDEALFEEDTSAARVSFGQAFKLMTIGGLLWSMWW